MSVVDFTSSSPHSSSFGIATGAVPADEIEAQQCDLSSKADLNMPGVPDEVIFARTPEGDPITWGAMRANADSAIRVQFLAHRLNSFVIGQYRELQQKNVNGPFVLGMGVMAGVEILGKVFYAKPAPQNAGEANKMAFCRFCGQLEARFGRPPPLEFRKAFVDRWGGARPGSVAEIFYTYFRNTLVHGFYGKAVFLTGEGTNDLLLRDDGCVLVHPDWLLQRFIGAAEVHVGKLVEAAPQSRMRRNALDYLHELLDEPPEPE